MVRTCGQKDVGRRSNEKMEVNGHRKMGSPNLLHKKKRTDDGDTSTVREEAQYRRTWVMKTRS